eukprot:3595114-Pleurochrysis_carterae.AAC.1
MRRHERDDDRIVALAAPPQASQRKPRGRAVGLALDCAEQWRRDALRRRRRRLALSACGARRLG